MRRSVVSKVILGRFQCSGCLGDDFRNRWRCENGDIQGGSKVAVGNLKPEIQVDGAKIYIFKQPNNLRLTNGH